VCDKVADLACGYGDEVTMKVLVNGDRVELGVMVICQRVTKAGLGGRWCW